MISRVKLALGRSTLLVLVALCGYQYRLLEQRLSRPATTDSSQPMLTLAPHNPAELAPPAMSFSDFLRPDNRIQSPAESPYEHGLTVAHRAEELPYVMRFPLAGSLSNIKFIQQDDALKIFGLHQQKFYTATDNASDSLLIRINSFTQTIPLPADADVDQLAHRMEDGHLVIEIPRLRQSHEDLYGRNFI